MNLTIAILGLCLVPIAVAVCSAGNVNGGSYDLTTGNSITLRSDSDGYGPLNYGNNQDCWWYISCSSGSMQISGSVDTENGYDVLRVRAGQSITGTTLWSRSGQYSSTSYIAYYSQITVTWTTDSSITDDGWTLTFTCGASSGGIPSAVTPAPPYSAGGGYTTGLIDAGSTFELIMWIVIGGGSFIVFTIVMTVSYCTRKPKTDTAHHQSPTGLGSPPPPGNAFVNNGGYAEAIPVGDEELQQINQQYSSPQPPQRNYSQYPASPPQPQPHPAARSEESYRSPSFSNNNRQDSSLKKKQSFFGGGGGGSRPNDARLQRSNSSANYYPGQGQSNSRSGQYELEG